MHTRSLDCEGTKRALRLASTIGICDKTLVFQRDVTLQTAGPSSASPKAASLKLESTEKYEGMIYFIVLKTCLTLMKAWHILLLGIYHTY